MTLLGPTKTKHFFKHNFFENYRTNFKFTKTLKNKIFTSVAEINNKINASIMSHRSSLDDECSNEIKITSSKDGRTPEKYEDYIYNEMNALEIVRDRIHKNRMSEGRLPK